MTERHRERSEEAVNRHDSGFLGEFLGFLRYNKRWWLVPILVITLGLVLLALVTATPVAPFIYRHF